MKNFRILDSKSIKEIPWGVIEPHRTQAYKNHYQSLEELNSRGGLGLKELWCVLHDIPYTHNLHEDKILEFIQGIIND